MTHIRIALVILYIKQTSGLQNGKTVWLFARRISMLKNVYQNYSVELLIYDTCFHFSLIYQGEWNRKKKNRERCCCRK